MDPWRTIGNWGLHTKFQAILSTFRFKEEETIAPQGTREAPQFVLGWSPNIIVSYIKQKGGGVGLYCRFSLDIWQFNLLVTMLTRWCTHSARTKILVMLCYAFHKFFHWKKPIFFHENAKLLSQETFLVTKTCFPVTKTWIFLGSALPLYTAMFVSQLVS